ncbi:MAG TPA: tetratricopeptide repeat protein [Flavobacterium sp.]|uniref:tetratricopeptide repeat protein n=1 Tax=Flavobacterium sp. TaxID=239 RepID=UPI002CE0AB53|nr:tetratricopeptide repeat protein [Flavobacterium sp.]HSD14829.1 tetratricopeptide repeat protein [Flavobacterium sp.]
MRRFLILLLFPFLLWSQSDFEKGESLFKQKKYASALPFFQNVLKQNPNDTRTVEYLGDIAGYQQQWDVAIGYFEKLRLQYPKVANYHYKFGGSMAMKAKSVSKFKAFGMIGDIEEAFETAARLDRKHIDTRWALVLFYIELPGIVGGSEAKAQKYAEELVQLSKVDGYLAKGYIDVYFKRYNKAENNLKKAYEIGHSKTTFEKLYDLYLNKLKNVEKARKLKADFNR